MLLNSHSAEMQTLGASLLASFLRQQARLLPFSHHPSCAVFVHGIARLLPSHLQNAARSQSINVFTLRRASIDPCTDAWYLPASICINTACTAFDLLPSAVLAPLRQCHCLHMLSIPFFARSPQQSIWHTPRHTQDRCAETWKTANHVTSTFLIPSSWPHWELCRSTSGCGECNESLHGSHQTLLCTINAQMGLLTAVTFDPDMAHHL